MRSACLLAVAVVGLVAREARADATFGLSFAIASRPDAATRIVDDAWVAAQIDEANRLFAPLGTTFRWYVDKPLADAHAAMHTRGDRDGLTPLTEDRVVDVFVVRELEDVDEPGRYRRGVCWTGQGGKRFLILSQIAGRSVLAHELGHFFGNPHSSVTDNLMSYSRTGAPPFLDEKQDATIRSFAARFLTSGRLIDIGPPIRFF